MFPAERNQSEETDPEGVTFTGVKLPSIHWRPMWSAPPSRENQDSLNSYDSEGGEDKHMSRILIIYPLHFPGYPMAQGNQIKNENPKDNNEFDC